MTTVDTDEMRAEADGINLTHAVGNFAVARLLENLRRTCDALDKARARRDEWERTAVKYRDERDTAQATIREVEKVAAQWPEDAAAADTADWADGVEHCTSDIRRALTGEA